MLTKTPNSVSALCNRLLDCVGTETNYEIREDKLESTLLNTVRKLNETKKPEELLRAAGFKIKLVTPTSFGTQIEFSKKYEDDEIKDVLKNIDYKMKNKSVFIID